ncbi:ABC transporter ATP-binding protein [Acetobacter thailandicus]|uniref:ABC transporter ATP-binding protein n=1 Tax=Acetobacter thailandicus TaxID=1502842 RepID=UPI001BAB0029|nr:ABC transporter ATP-binding protein [Acetobacter thailandicus]MBS0961236.1 ABC transporter ATP-binding protein [Acetobacter thailandicus]
MSLLHFENINKSYKNKSLSLFNANPVQILHNINFSVNPGEIVGVIGESGSGKSTIGRLAVRLSKPDSGRIFFENTDLSNLSDKAFQPYRKKIQIILQDPHNSLNPSLTIGASIEEALITQHQELSRAERQNQICALLTQCGLSPLMAGRRPGELSGGQKQRVGIARALAVNPSLIVADEIVAALDVSVQARILNLMFDLRDQFNISYLFISHDLSVVRRICDRVIVLYRGRIVESGFSKDVFTNPCHEYTRKLLSFR